MEIWIGRDGERHGPYKEDDVRRWLRSGKVSRDDLAWYEGLADWQPLSVLLPDEGPDATVTGSDGASPIASSVSVAPLPQVTALSLEDYAGFWKRVGAYILDFLVLYIPNMLISKMMGGDAAEAVMRQTQEAAPGNMDVLFAALNQYYATMAPAMMITFVLAWLYFAFCESSAWQATVGKLALGIRVTDLHGERITLPRALARYPAKILCVLTMLIGFLMVAFTQRKQGLHDLIAGTLVLNGRVGEFKPKSTTDNNNSFSA